MLRLFDGDEIPGPDIDVHVIEKAYQLVSDRSLCIHALLSITPYIARPWAEACGLFILVWLVPGKG
jgi:hypothetical protein